MKRRVIIVLLFILWIGSSQVVASEKHTLNENENAPFFDLLSVKDGSNLNLLPDGAILIDTFKNIEGDAVAVENHSNAKLVKKPIDPWDEHESVSTWAELPGRKTEYFIFDLYIEPNSQMEITPIRFDSYIRNIGPGLLFSSDDNGIVTFSIRTRYDALTSHDNKLTAKKMVSSVGRNTTNKDR